MTCRRINVGGRPGIICFSDLPLIVVTHGGKTFRFERSAACGLLPVNANGNQRLSPVPGVVWDMASEIQKTLDRKERVLRRLRTTPGAAEAEVLEALKGEET